MSRLGDLLRTERLRRNMTLKQVARLGGVSEGILLTWRRAAGSSRTIRRGASSRKSG